VTAKNDQVGGCQSAVDRGEQRSPVVTAIHHAQCYIVRNGPIYIFAQEVRLMAFVVDRLN
jgi:hypothetical protein